MELAVGFLLLNVLHFGICGFINKGFIQFGVELSVFSGRSSPTWVIDRNNPMYPYIAATINNARPSRMGEKLGYGGFIVEMKNPMGQRVYKTVGAGSNPRLELMLLNSSPFPLERSVRRHVIDTVRRMTPLQPYITLQAGFPSRPPFPMQRCRIPRYDPETWNASPTIRQNNCYNYATQRPTGTFAQPGRASGRRFSRPITVRGILGATVSDGLVPLPFFNPQIFPGKCYMALAVWPETDYHFYRLDSNMLWSHKPGKTAVKNTDNSGNLISDPKTADRGEYTVFVGYLGNHPGVRVL